jgi:sugar/nucleoside kinase (ribokinase family)
MKKVCTIGSATRDIFMLCEGADTMSIHTDHSDVSYMLLPQGAKIDVPQVHFSTGGGATNVAVGLKRLGLDVEAFFRTGNDAHGLAIKEYLHKEHIGTQYCTVDKKHETALSVIIPSVEHDHVALCYRAANRTHKKEDFPFELLQELDLIYFGPLGGQSTELFSAIAPRAQEAQVTVSCNPSRSQLTHKTDDLVNALKFCDILFVNAVESGYLMQTLLKQQEAPMLSFSRSTHPALLENYMSFPDANLNFSVRTMAPYLLESGPKTIIITNGSEGVYLVTPRQIYFHQSIPTTFQFSLGAGDAFNSGFLGAYMQGLSIEYALMYGIANASSVIQYPDAKQGLLDLDTLQKRIANSNMQLLKTYAL